MLGPALKQVNARRYFRMPAPYLSPGCYLRPLPRLHLSHLQVAYLPRYDQTLNREVSVHRRFAILTSLLVLISISIACASKPSTDETSGTGTAHHPFSLFGKQETTLPAGTTITVRLANAVGSKVSNSGDQFHGSVATPVEVDGKVV